MKKNKLNLCELKLKSFVTDHEKDVIKGGVITISPFACTSRVGHNSVCTCPIH